MILWFSHGYFVAECIIMCAQKVSSVCPYTAVLLPPPCYPCRSQPWCSMEKFINILGDLWQNLYNSNNGILGTLNGHVVGRAAGLMRECRLGFTVQAESGQVENGPGLPHANFQEGSTIPTRAFFQSITSAAHSLFPTLWSLYGVLFIFISIYSAHRGLFFLIFCFSHFSLTHTCSLSLWLSLLYLANYQIKEHPTQSFLI